MNIRHRFIPKTLRTASGATLIEFAVAFCAFVVFFVWPLINLALVGSAYILVSLTMNESLIKAANSSSYGEALSVVKGGARLLCDSNLSRLCGLQSPDGDSTPDVSLFVAVTDIKSGKISYSASNRPGTIDLSKHLCEYIVKVNFNIHPRIQLSGVPVVGDIPLIGKALSACYTARRHLEHPEVFARVD